MPFDDNSWLSSYVFWSRVARGETSANGTFYISNAKMMLNGLCVMARDELQRHVDKGGYP